MSNNTGIFPKHVVFDLDETLVDSAPSTLAPMLAVFNEEGIEPAQPLTLENIGRSLTVAMASLLAQASLDKLPRLTEAFKRRYDVPICSVFNRNAASVFNYIARSSTQSHAGSRHD